MWLCTGGSRDRAVGWASRLPATSQRPPLPRRHSHPGLAVIAAGLWRAGRGTTRFAGSLGISDFKLNFLARQR